MNLTKQEFLNCADSAKYTQSSHKTRVQLENDMREWLEKGGVVKDLGCIEEKPKRSHSAHVNPFVSEYKARFLIRWSKFKHGRSARIQEATCIDKKRLIRLLAPTKTLPMTHYEYDLIRSVMKKIEEMED